MISDTTLASVTIFLALFAAVAISIIIRLQKKIKILEKEKFEIEKTLDRDMQKLLYLNEVIAKEFAPHIRELQKIIGKVLP